MTWWAWLIVVTTAVVFVVSILVVWVMVGGFREDEAEHYERRRRLRFVETYLEAHRLGLSDAVCERLAKIGSGIDRPDDGPGC